MKVNFISSERAFYKKIEHQEALTASLADDAENRGWIADTEAYVRSLPAAGSDEKAEPTADQLQDLAADAEARYARLVRDVTGETPERQIGMFSAAFRFGQEHALPKETGLLEAFQDLESFFLNGSPDENVDKLVSQSDRDVVWEQTQDVHAPFWKDMPEGTGLYYRLRNCVMDGMLSKTPLQVRMEEGRFIITYR